MTTKNQKKLSNRQLAVIDDLFAGGMDEPAVLKKHRLTTGIYRKWLADELFAEELALRAESARRQSEFILAKFAPVAAAKLVTLTESDKDETVRKACLDIISASYGPKTSADDETPCTNESNEPLSPTLAAKLLETLAKDE